MLASSLYIALAPDLVRVAVLTDPVGFIIGLICDLTILC